MKKYDAIIIGSGQGGGPLAHKLADLEWKVAFIEKEHLGGDHIFINTGTRPRIPDIPGLDQVDYLTNRNIMDLTEAPDHLLVLGGNYLGLEFGQMFRRFGSRVTVVELMDQITPREDEDVAETLQKALEAEGMAFHVGAKTTRVVKTAAGYNDQLSLICNY